MSVLTFVESHKPRVFDKIQFLIAQTSNNISMRELEYNEYLNSLLHFSTRGKCIRGGLFLFSAEMFGAKITEDHFDIAASLELIHAALLIHDDCMDGDRIRHGEPTIFETFAQKGSAQQISRPDDYGKSVATCIGDIALFIAFESLMRLVLISATQKIAMYSYLSTKLIQTCIAQIHDVGNGMTSRETTLSHIEAVNTYKTACYTFQMPLMLGYYSSATIHHSVRESIEKLGIQMGSLYQLRDDYIGLMIDEKMSGKKPGSDIRENKKTYLRSVLIEQVNQDDKEVLTTLLGNKMITPAQIQFVRDLFRSSGAEETYITSLELHVKKSYEYIEQLPISKLHKKSIQEFIFYLTNRTK